MLKRNVCLEIEEGSVDEVKGLVEGFARVRVVEWGMGRKEGGRRGSDKGNRRGSE